MLISRGGAAAILACLLAGCATLPKPCATPGIWLSPATSAPVADPLEGDMTAGVVLLGEHHDVAADHAWQLASIKILFERHPNLKLGFEMFPRRSQKTLDRFVAGGLTETQFLADVDWRHVWGFDPNLYWPIFRFARDHRIPMIALNIDSGIVRRVSHEGFAAVPAADREGVGAPAPPSDAYTASLREAMAGHGGPAMTAARLAHFIDAQLLWDRAMAEAVAAQRRAQPGRLVVALMGAGHLENGDGVPHQLRALGVADVKNFIPVPADCTKYDPGFADAVYLTPKS